VVLAIATGISGFATVLSTYAILTRELERGYRATEPASAILSTDWVDAELIASLPPELGAGAAEARRVVNARIKTGPAQWRDLRLLRAAGLHEFCASARCGRRKARGRQRAASC
jgi:hypothetical protein